jgi:hypothetical protein
MPSQTKLVRIVATGVPEIFAVTEVNTDARPSHPIALPGDPWWGDNLKPSHPIALPGDPWWGDDLKPEHPIVLPPDGEVPPDPPPASSMECRWAYQEGEGWVLYCKAGPYDKPRPQRR